MHPPELRLGIVGFRDETHLANVLKTRRSVRWLPWAAIDADALWVNGEHAQPARNHVVRVPSVRPDAPATLLSLRDIDRPTAFALPLGNGYLTPPEVFDPRSAKSIAEVLQGFEYRLRPLATQLAVAHQVAARRYQLSSPVYHLSDGKRLLAVLDVAGSVGIEPSATPDDIAEAQWLGRPKAAAAIPSHFSVVSMTQMMWQFVLRSDEDLLPEKYRKSPIYFRRPPLVARGLLKDAQLALLAELAAAPSTFEQLQQEIGLGDKAMAQALGALYYAGSITTDPQRAAPGRAAAIRSRPEGDPSQASLGSAFTGLPPERPKRGKRDLDTVPTPLEQGKSANG
ncbi:MAG TPA: hypothetical protein VEA35_05925 [Ramlibacter sp.]|nr:hypothetical protein [Aquabacterium sp.]HYF41971.1 hypothetical protein [Ramlibacter sp.]